MIMFMIMMFVNCNYDRDHLQQQKNNVMNSELPTLYAILRWAGMRFAHTNKFNKNGSNKSVFQKHCRSQPQVIYQ